jgi:L-threonylcarbamoyladenylate synthase
VALPTETVYGLAANALDAAAVRKVFEIKGRPAHNPVIVHVAGIQMARRCVSVNGWPESADLLARAFWPGPLTLVMDRAGDIPDEVSAGGGTIGVRWPAHPFMQAVIQACGFPLAAPSANRSNQTSPTQADHVIQSLGSALALVVDGGASQVGIESTVLDLTAKPPRVLRPGMIHEGSLAAVVGALSARACSPGEPLRSPGLLDRHYSPQARLRMCSWIDEADLAAQIRATGLPVSGIHLIAHTRIPLGIDCGRVSVIPGDAAAFARAIYAELHACDAAGAALILVEALPDGPAWLGIADRLARASRE